MVDKGNTVYVIEHNTDVIKAADYVIELGPGAGEEGGEVIYTGTPQGLLSCTQSVTARYLADANNRYKRLFAISKHLCETMPDTVISYSASSSMIACILKGLGKKYKLIVSERNTTQKIDFRERCIFFCYKWADIIVPNSQSQSDFISQQFPNLNRKTKVITNFVDTKYFSPGGQGSSKKNHCNMICVGRVFPQKNVIRFLDVVAELKRKGVNLHVDWYGRTEGVYAVQCTEKVEKLQLDDVFAFKGATKDIRDEYRKGDVFCLPSLYEGFPNVLCEAMSCGLPVLCSRVCDNPNIAVEGVSGFLFDPLSVDEMTDAIIRFMGLDDNTRKRMGDNNREIALSRFSSETFINKYLDII
jgi:glycosyltransferase involved in cell wall biosynthesis